MTDEPLRVAFTRELTKLETQGLNWASYVPAEEGPDSEQLSAGEGLLLLLAMGPTFGENTPYSDPTRANPFDERTLLLLTPLLELWRAEWDANARVVYPGQQAHLPLMKWLEAARVHLPSRLGIGIRPDCGTWFAVRAAVCGHLPAGAQSWLKSRYPGLSSAQVSPCERCVEAPCIRACPGAAVSDTLDFERCVGQRLLPESSCAARCAARDACPVGHSARYPDAQTAYHYRVSLNMLRRWRLS